MTLDYKALSGATATVASILAFLYREYRLKNRAHDTRMEDIDDKLSKVKDRVLVLETVQARTEPEIRQVLVQQQSHGMRIAATEEAIGHIRSDVSEIKAALTSKLDKLPELTEALNNFKDMARTFIPRPEVEARFDATDQRLARLEEKP